MRAHRYYIGGRHDKRGQLQLEHKVWVHDKELLNQWSRVLRYRIGDQLILFDGEGDDRLYRVIVIEPTSFGLELVTQLEPQRASRHTYLLWSLLKSDKNDLVLQKATELGVTNFIPIIAERTEKLGFDETRSMRIVIEATEQCGRSDVPHVREPLGLSDALGEYMGKLNLYVCEQGNAPKQVVSELPDGALVGPEGGWSEAELHYFEELKLPHIGLGEHTLRAETAAIMASGKLVQL